MCFPPPASILTGASAADHEEVRFVQTPFWISSIWADDDFRRIENQFEEGPVMLEDKLGPWSELGEVETEKSKFGRISCRLRQPESFPPAGVSLISNIQRGRGARMTRFLGPESSCLSCRDKRPSELVKRRNSPLPTALQSDGHFRWQPIAR